MCVYIYTYIHTYIYIYIYTHTYICIYTYIYTYTHTHTHIYIYICMYSIYTYLGRHMLIDYQVYCIFVGTSCSLYICHKTKCAQGYHTLFFQIGKLRLQSLGRLYCIMYQQAFYSLFQILLSNYWTFKCLFFFAEILLFVQ